MAQVLTPATFQYARPMTLALISSQSLLYLRRTQRRVASHLLCCSTGISTQQGLYNDICGIKKQMSTYKYKIYITLLPGCYLFRFGMHWRPREMPLVSPVMLFLMSTNSHMTRTSFTTSQLILTWSSFFTILIWSNSSRLNSVMFSSFRTTQHFVLGIFIYQFYSSAWPTSNPVLSFHWLFLYTNASLLARTTISSTIYLDFVQNSTELPRPSFSPTVRQP